jgi:hypothetical protein
MSSFYRLGAPELLPKDSQIKYGVESIGNRQNV